MNSSSLIESVPVIDIAPLLASYEGQEENGDTTTQFADCIRDLGLACKEWGFFYVQNHGISPTTLEVFQQNMKKFFFLPPGELDNLRRTNTNSRGYFDDELTKTKLDWKRCFDFGAQDGSLDKDGMDGYNQWPLKTEKSTFEDTMREYFDSMESLSEILLGAIMKGLGLNSDKLKHNFVNNHTSFLRLNYYPVCPNPKSSMAVHHHTDAGALTVLLQDSSVTSLQVYQNESWHFVPPRDGTFVINIGDMMQVWSNDLYKAPLHRVQANSSSARYSAPFFYNPSYDCDVKPLAFDIPSFGDNANYKTVNWGEFRSKRFAGDFADLGEEVQISNYRFAEAKE